MPLRCHSIISQRWGPGGCLFFCFCFFFCFNGYKIPFAWLVCVTCLVWSAVRVQLSACWCESQGLCVVFPQGRYMEGRHCLSAATIISGLAGEVPSEAAAQESECLCLFCPKRSHFLLRAEHISGTQAVCFWVTESINSHVGMGYGKVGVWPPPTIMERLFRMYSISLISSWRSMKE